MKVKLHEPSRTPMIDIDRIFQDTYLLAIELRYGSDAAANKALRMQCMSLVEGARTALQDAGMNTRSIDLMIHAQCALLDEVVLANAPDNVRQAWINEPLQARFFGHHRAGETLHEEMRQVLREPAPDLHVLTLYQRVMMLGFLGGHQTLEDENRLKLVRQLSPYAPSTASKHVSTLIDGRRPLEGYLRWLRSPAVHLVGAGLALAVVWWLMERSLAHSIAVLERGGF